jgi:hypothetical protein
MMQTETTPTAPTAQVPTIIDSAETQLANEIGDLWQVHTEAQTSLHKTRYELKLIRANLSRRLHELKFVLSRPGRGGAWSSFLEGQKIPRSTADRLVRGHERSLVTEDRINCASEQITEPTEITVQRYMQGLWPRLSRFLATPESVELFIAALRETAAKSFAANGESSDSSASEDMPADGTPRLDQ